MEFEKFVSKIKFRYIRPETPLPWKYHQISWFFDKCFKFSFESFNTIFPENDREIKINLNKLRDVPRFSTIAVGAIINYGVRNLEKGQSFVNVGVWNGFTYLAGMMNNPGKNCVGIDNFSEFGGPRQQFLERFNKMRSQNHFFYDMDYEKYFSEIQEGRDRILYV